MPGHRILHHLNDGRQAVRIQRRTQRPEIMVPVPYAVIPVRHGSNPFHIPQGCLQRNRADTQVVVDGIPGNQGTGAFIQQDHFSLRMPGAVINRDNPSAAQVKLLSVFQIVDYRHRSLFLRSQDIRFQVIRIKMKQIIGRHRTPFHPAGDMADI